MITVNDLSPRIASVMEASREVARSRRLRKLLELVLALGEYKTLQIRIRMVSPVLSLKYNIDSVCR